MAKITAGGKESVFQIKKWLGLNESADGDKRLKLGEAAQVQN